MKFNDMYHYMYSTCTWQFSQVASPIFIATQSSIIMSPNPHRATVTVCCCYLDGIINKYRDSASQLPTNYPPPVHIVGSWEYLCLYQPTWDQGQDSFCFWIAIHAAKFLLRICQIFKIISNKPLQIEIAVFSIFSYTGETCLPPEYNIPSHSVREACQNKYFL